MVMAIENGQSRMGIHTRSDERPNTKYALQPHVQRRAFKWQG